MNGADFRIFYEKYGAYKLAEYFGVDPSVIKHPSKDIPTYDYDLEYNSIKIDVKISSPVIVSSNKTKSIWDFSLRKVKDGVRGKHDGKYCDYFLLIGMQNGIPKRTFLVPISKAPTNHLRISISGISKYYKYEI